MKVIDPGHKYALHTYDGGPAALDQELVFMKRQGKTYPGNVGNGPGTNCQELIRVLIDRVQYLDRQIQCEENKLIIVHLRAALLAFESRAAERHDRELGDLPAEIETIAACNKCGHIRCQCTDSTSIREMYGLDRDFSGDPPTGE